MPCFQFYIYFCIISALYGIWNPSGHRRLNDSFLSGRRHQVAVKCLSKERMQNNTLAFMKEYEIMQSIEHANIVRLFGVVVSETSQILLITELAPLRSLLECLKELSLRSTFNVPVISDFAKQVCIN